MTNDAIRITVEDHGTGIADAVRAHMFEPFFTTKDKSVGAGSVGKSLGLFVSYAVVQEHGGALSVDSEVGQWTRFCIDLPAVPADVPQAQTLQAGLPVDAEAQAGGQQLEFPVQALRPRRARPQGAGAAGGDASGKWTVKDRKAG